jgi:glycosyltransferase involved in cell wall biosynthesis
MNYTLPYVSVIIPVLNGERTIKECLHSLIGMDYPRGQREILVVDNGSTDRTIDIIKRYPVRCVVETRQGASYARNLGIEVSNGQILAFTDADCIVTTGWLRELVRGFDDEEVGVVAGEVVAFPPKTPAERYTAIRKPTWHERTLAHPETPWFVTGSVAVRREVIDEVGCFDPVFVGAGCEDIDFSWRFFQRSRFKLNHRPKAIVFHRHRSSSRELFKQYFSYGHGQNVLKRKHPQLIDWSWKQEIGAYKDLLLSLFSLGYAAFDPSARRGNLSEFSYLYFELVRKLSERIGFIYGIFRRFRV